jgi:hypothetical protein
MTAEHSLSSSSPPPSPGLGSVLERWSQAATLVTGLTVGVSVLYNWAYFQVVSPKSIELMKISDHISSALEWLPASILAYTASILGTMLTTSSHSVVWASGEWPGKIWLVVGCVLVGIIVIGQLFATPFDYSTEISVGYMLFILCALRVLSNKLWTWHETFIWIFAPLLVTVSLVQGDRQGISDITATSPNAILMLKMGPPLENTFILRNFDKGVLARNLGNNAVVFLPWEQVARIVMSPEATSRQWRVCLVFHIFCSSENR